MGRKLYRDLWTGKEADAREAQTIGSVAFVGMEKDEQTGHDTRLLMSEETAEQIKEIATDLRAKIPDEERQTRKRLEYAIRVLRTPVRDGLVTAHLDYFGGGRSVIDPSEWEAIGGKLWLDYANSLGGFSGRKDGPDGEVWLDRDQLEKCLDEIPTIPTARVEQKKLTREKHKTWVAMAREIAASSACPLYHGKPNVSEIARRIRNRRDSSEDVETIRKILNSDRSAWGGDKRR
ncbi:MAG: hypothetical protein OEM59_21060 [Rhodospirillales bacterium]|nr:hypothetical protein [Rhodospirillales bacterium]